MFHRAGSERQHRPGTLTLSGAASTMSACAYTFNGGTCSSLDYSSIQPTEGMAARLSTGGERQCRAAFFPCQFCSCLLVLKPPDTRLELSEGLTLNSRTSFHHPEGWGHLDNRAWPDYAQCGQHQSTSITGRGLASHSSIRAPIARAFWVVGPRSLPAPGRTGRQFRAAAPSLPLPPVPMPRLPLLPGPTQATP